MEDILTKVQDILDDPQKLEEFKNLASSLLGNQSSQGDSQVEAETKSEDSQEADGVSNVDIESILKNFTNQSGQSRGTNNSDQIEIPINMDMILKIKNAMTIMNSDDKNIAFLRALRELLGGGKQNRIDDAIKIVRIVRLLPLVKDLNILKNLRII